MFLMSTRTSPYGRIVRMAAMQRGIDDLFETRFVATRVPDTPIIEYNPTGKVPTLVLETGEVLSETRHVCEYLDALHSDAPIAPVGLGAPQRSLEGVAVGFLDGIAVWAREVRRPENERSPTILAHERARVDRCINYFNIRVESLGEPTTYAMLCVIVGLAQLGISVPEYAWCAGVPALAEWYQRGTARPEFVATDPASSAST